MLGADPELRELVADMNAVFDTDSKANGSTVFPVFQPMFDDVTDQRIGVHPAFELADNVVALLDPHSPGNVATDRSIDPRLDQEAAHDQVRDLRRLDHHVENVSEPATIAPAWRRGHAEQVCIRVKA